MPEVMLDAVTSDPVRMGWMQGHPPAPDRIIHAANAGHMRFPTTRWAFSNMRQFCPSRRVAAGEPAPAFPRALRADLADLAIHPLDGGAAVSLDEAMLEAFTDGFLVLHDGKVVLERWFGVTGPETRHILFSMTKSFTGVLVEMLIAEGRIDPAAHIGALIPELVASGFAEATVRQVLDMTTALDFSELYDDPESGIGAFSNALALTPRPAGYAGPSGICEFLTQMKPAGRHGDQFTYRTPNTDVLAWLVARTEGEPFDAVLSRRLWQPLGMGGDADILVDPVGTPFAGGGLNCRLEDLARFGEAIRQGGQGRLGGQGVIPQAVVQRVFAGGDPAKFPADTYPFLPGASYGSQWWVTHDAHGAISARGIHGQTLWIDPAARMVVARFASHPIAANGANDPLSLPLFSALAAALN